MAIFDQPEEEGLEDADMIMDGVLFEGSALVALADFEGGDPLMDLREGGCTEGGRDEPTPAGEGAGDLVAAMVADVPGGLALPDVLPDEIVIVLGDCLLGERPGECPIPGVALCSGVKFPHHER